MAAAVLGALFNGAWQGTLLCVFALVVLGRLRRLNAVTLHALWAVLLGLCLALPVLNYASAMRIAESRTSSTTGPSAGATVTSSRRDVALPPLQSQYQTIDSRASLQTDIETNLNALRDFLFSNSSAFLSILAAIAFIRAMLVLRNVVSLHRARGRVTPINAPVELPTTKRHFTFGTSAEFASPCVLGFSAPIIVLPPALLSAPCDELRSIVCHELEHVSRFDDIVTVAIHLVEAIAFFNPGVLIASRRLALYGEQICDDAALELGTSPASFARILTETAERALVRRPAVPCLIFARKQLVTRVRALLDVRADHTLQLLGRPLLVAVPAIGIAVAIVVQMQLPVAATSQHHAYHSSETAEGALDTPPFTGSFTISKCPTPTEVQIRLAYQRERPGERESHDVSSCVAFAQLRGLRAAEFAGALTHRNFEIVRDSGTMRVAGTTGASRAVGTWTFSLSPSFAQELQRRGITPPNVRQQMLFTISNFEFRTLDSLLENGFAKPSLQDLERMVELGVSHEMVASLSKLPTLTKTVGGLNEAAEAGVTASYIDELLGLGIRPSLAELVRLSEAGVTPQWVKQMRRSGHPLRTVDELIAYRERGF